MSAAVEYICRPKAGEQACGDTAVVVRGKGATAIVLIDALGHGPAAAEAAETGRRWLACADPGEGAGALMWGLHRALQGTRGAAATVCTVSGQRVEVAAVGNVGLRAHGARIDAFSSPGILGVRLRAVKTTVSELRGPTRIVLFSDGVGHDMRVAEVDRLAARRACETLLDRYGRADDDASLVVVDLDARSSS